MVVSHLPLSHVW